jgi:chaperonin GroES
VRFKDITTPGRRHFNPAEKAECFETKQTSVVRLTPLKPLSERKIGTMKLRPLQDRILVQRVKEDERTKGGIIIPDTAKEKPIEGTVIAAGNGKLSENGKRVALDVKNGDRILFGKYSGTEVKMEGEEYLIMREDDVFGVIK